MKDTGKKLRIALAASVIVGAAGITLSYPYWSQVSDPAPAKSAGRGVVEFSNFSARHERSPEGQRLSVALRLRTSVEPELPCFVFVLARNRNDPKIWSAWPPQNDGRAVTRTGHFQGAYPAAGYGVILTPSWERVTSTHPEGESRFDAVVVYVVAADGRVLLSRPFLV